MTVRKQKQQSATVTLTSHGHWIEVSPALPALKRRLTTWARGYAQIHNAGQSFHVPMPLHHHNVVGLPGPEPFLAYGAGLEPVVCRIAEEEGYQIKRKGCHSSPLPVPAPLVKGFLQAAMPNYS